MCALHSRTCAHVLMSAIWGCTRCAAPVAVPCCAVGTFANTRRWAAEGDKTLLVLKGQVPVRDGRVCYAGASVAGGEALEAVTFATRAKAVSVDSLPEEAVLAALGGDKVSWTPPRALLQMVQLLPESEDEVSAVCGAVSLLAWHAENQFSGIDGSATQLADGGQKRLRGGRSLHPRASCRRRARSATRGAARSQGKWDCQQRSRGAARSLGKCPPLRPGAAPSSPSPSRARRIAAAAAWLSAALCCPEGWAAT